MANEEKAPKRGRPRKAPESIICARTVRRRAHEEVQAWVNSVNSYATEETGAVGDSFPQDIHVQHSHGPLSDSGSTSQEPEYDYPALEVEVEPATTSGVENRIDCSDYCNYDCERCIGCRCISCDECMHDDNGDCTHCLDCLVEDSVSSREIDIILDAEHSEGEEAIQGDDVPLNDAMKNDLINIVLKHNMTHDAVYDILGFLRKYKCGMMPKCPKTLLRTPKSTMTRSVPPGEYWHNGVTKLIQKYVEVSDAVSVELTFSVDGVPLGKSSNSSFWPLLCSFNNSPQVYLIGCYFGNVKPTDANDYLRDFVEEVVPLCERGLEFRGKIIPVRVVSAVCDAPAKSFICKTKGHNGYFSCSKCMQEGEMIDGRMTFREINCALRTDEGFISHVQEEYHKGHTILERVPNFGLVSCIGLDYLHVLLLGVVRKTFYLWLHGPLSVRLSGSKITQCSQALTNLVDWVPQEFVRRPRSLDFVKRFKATEFRQILLYTGPVVFSTVLPCSLYEHFLVLHVATTIIVNPVFCKVYNAYARDLFKFYVQAFEKLYGPQFISHNVHALIHLCDDTAHFGCLDNFSSFKFENFMQSLKVLVRKGEKPLQQLARRYAEMEQQSFTRENRKCQSQQLFSSPHTEGPLLRGCISPQYKVFTHLNGWKVTLSDANNCCMLTNGGVVLVYNFAYSSVHNGMVIIGREYTVCEDLYSVPCPSSTFGILFVSAPSQLKAWDVNAISKKLYRMPWKSGFAVFPLHHCEK